MPSQNYARRMPDLASWQNADQMYVDRVGSPTQVDTTGRKWLTFSGSGQYLSNYSVAAFSSLFAFHVIKWTTIGYHNIYDNGSNPMLWVDNQSVTGKLEQNAGTIRTASAYGDGNWHVVFSWHSTSGTQLWVDNVSQGTHGSSVTVSGKTLTRFHRAGGQTFNGSCMSHGFMTRLPNAAERTILYNSLRALTTTWTPPNYGADFTLASTNYLLGPDVTTGNFDSWAACWFQLKSKTGVFQILIGKEGSAGRDFNLFWSQTGDLMYWSIFHSGGRVDVTAAAPAVNTWTHVFVYHDSVNDTIGMKINNGTATTAATSGVSPDNTGCLLRLGSIDDGYYLDGRIDNACYGTSPPGGIAALTTSLPTSLYNSGVGKSYQSLTAAEKTAWGLVSFWNLDEASGTRYDAHGSNHLTDVNSVGRTQGAPFATT